MTLIGESADTKDFFGQMEKLISGQGLVMTALAVKAADTAKASIGTKGAKNVTSADIGIINLELDVIGIDYVSLKNLLKVLESNSRLFDVAELQFSLGDKSAKLSINTYYLHK
jgi:hypothetical protein